MASSTNFVLQVGDILVDENRATVNDVTNLGMLNPPVTISGTIWGSGHDPYTAEYTADKDFVYFQVPYGNFRFSLSWEPVTADYDLILYSETGILGMAQTSSDNPEIIGPQALTANTTYGFGVYAWDGGPGTWTLQVQWEPNVPIHRCDSRSGKIPACAPPSPRCCMRCVGKPCFLGASRLETVCDNVLVVLGHKRRGTMLSIGKHSGSDSRPSSRHRRRSSRGLPELTAAGTLLVLPSDAPLIKSTTLASLGVPCERPLHRPHSAH